jgi:hypothetical protein
MNRLTREILENNLPVVFTSEDVKYLEPDDNIRYCQMKWAMERGDVVRIRRGFYTLNKIFRKELLNLTSLAQKFNPDSYISLESALRNARWIPEHVTEIMSVTSRPSSLIKTEFTWFSYRKIPQEHIFAGVHRVSRGNYDYLEAKPLKALADYVYELKYNWDSLEPLVESLRIESDNLETLTGDDFDEIQGNYEVSNVENFLSGIRKELAV